MPSNTAEGVAGSSVAIAAPARTLRRQKKRNLSLSQSADFQFSPLSRRKRPRTGPRSTETASQNHSSAKGKEKAYPPTGDLVGPKVNGGVQEASGSLVVPYRAPSPCDSVASSHHTDEVGMVEGPSEESLEIQRLQKELSMKNEVSIRVPSASFSIRSLTPNPTR